VIKNEHAKRALDVAITGSSIAITGIGVSYREAFALVRPTPTRDRAGGL
jgi:hypothetical protein